MNQFPSFKTWTPPAGGIAFVSQDLDKEKELRYAGSYCPVCFPVSRDVVILFMESSPDVKEQIAIEWDVFLGQIADSAESGCQFCGFMAARFFHDQMFTIDFGISVESPVTGCCGSAPKGELTKDVKEAIEHLRHYAGDDNRITLIGESFERGRSASRLGKIRLSAGFTNLPNGDVRQILGVRSEIILELYTHKEDPGVELISTRPINIHPGSDESISWANSQIQECFQSHSGCPTFADPQLPKRLVRILDDEWVKIIEMEGYGQYTALSYCWGGPQTFSTRNESLQQHMAGFQTSKLPQTLQDAICLTRRLGIENIWIDSLCIIQDSQDDKDVEIPKMSEYYRNAYVTICAGGYHCSDGFLAIHDECKNHPGKGIAKDLLSMPYVSLDDSIGTIYFREERHYCLSDEGISSRGWTLQERILSPRSLTYGSRLVWQCNSCQKSEGGCEDWTFDLRSSGNRRLQVDFAQARREASSKGGQEAEVDKSFTLEIADFWYRVVEEYSTRKLGEATDKLPAISAIAADVGKLTGDTYIAGLWKSRVLKELLWSTYPDIRQQRQEVWCAPSWSWASVQNKISYRHELLLDATAVAEVVSCTANPVSTNGPYGRVQEHATLQLKAPVLHFENNKVDMIEKLLKQENDFPTMRNEDMGFEARRVMINAMTIPSMSGSSGRRDEWDKPENVALLALYAYQKQQANESPVENKSNTEDKTKSPLLPSFKKKWFRKSTTTSKQEDISTESEPSDQTVSRTSKDEGFLACLVITKRSDGKYERIGCLTKFWVMGGFSRVPNLVEVVELV